VSAFLTAAERQQIGICKSALAATVRELAALDNAPALVAAMAEMTAELSLVIAGPDLTVSLFHELARQVSNRDKP
jgi:hypothetical protein